MSTCCWLTYRIVSISIFVFASFKTADSSLYTTDRGKFVNVNCFLIFDYNNRQVKMDHTGKKNSGLRLKYSCKFPGCRSGYFSNINTNIKHQNRHFYKFPAPSKSELLKQWKLICNIAEDIDCGSYSVCENHFFQADFVNFSRHRLNRGVIPKHTELVVYHTETTVTGEASVILLPIKRENDEETASHETAPQKTQLKTKLQVLVNRIDSLDMETVGTLEKEVDHWLSHTNSGFSREGAHCASKGKVKVQEIPDQIKIHIKSIIRKPTLAEKSIVADLMMQSDNDVLTVRVDSDHTYCTSCSDHTYCNSCSDHTYCINKN
ncbi:uncharacterized protein LOC126427107 isoform X1 [Schistocerca serialis cubense]|uniref:uncharacterized protein LOC126427107 isoform X1 n=2 Tax=Schistocerca serialis cubense TaxID=2023355 RepID=UPI00214EA27D|nr:uncharacterized protein LOC126427107 isoform X1 [Schistocerca serialis cubense]